MSQSMTKLYKTFQTAAAIGFVEYFLFVAFIYIKLDYVAGITSVNFASIRLASVGAALAASFWIWLFPLKPRLLLLVLLDSLLSLLMAADVAYFRYFHDFRAAYFLQTCPLVSSSSSGSFPWDYLHLWGNGLC